MSRATTVFIGNQPEYTKCNQCHGGEGPFLLKDIIGARKEKLFIKWIHDDIVPPGSSFGYHQHKSESPFEEWYLVLSGEGVMQLDGKDQVMKAGDISACFANGQHGIKNAGKEDLRLLVICASPAKA